VVTRKVGRFQIRTAGALVIPESEAVSSLFLLDCSCSGEAGLASFLGCVAGIGTITGERFSGVAANVMMKIDK
jgi:hypothetical protein